MLLGERITLYFEDHTEHTDTLCGQNEEFVPHRNHIKAPLQIANRLIMFGETFAVYCENHTKHPDTLCGQNVVFVPHRKHITSPLQSKTG
jgi:hypothetical protein